MLLTKRSYLENVIGLWHFCNKVELSEISDLNSSFPFFSSVISYFFNDKINYEEQKELYREIHFYRLWAGVDDKEFTITDKIKIKDLSKAKPYISDEKLIFATFHIGSYRQINNFLISKNKPFFLLTDKNFIEKQGKAVSNTYNEACNHYNSTNLGDLVILNAEDPSVVFKIKNEFRLNKSLIVYLDGNTGAGENNLNNKNLLPITFFDKELLVRKGIGEISYLMNIPIVPVIMRRIDWTENEIIFGDIINVNHAVKREKYAEIDIKKLYGFLEDKIKKHNIINQWESWLYLHNFLNIKLLSKDKEERKHNTKNTITLLDLEEKSLIINHKIYDVISINPETRFLMNKKSLKIRKISDNFYNLLIFLDEKPKSFHEIKQHFPNIESKAYLELIEENILSYD